MTIFHVEITNLTRVDNSIKIGNNLIKGNQLNYI
jgi:hypothetical protein